MERRVVIVGAGISGLMACKHAIQKGFNPTVFEAESSVGGVWLTHIIKSTKLQNSRIGYRFSNFDWPPPSPESDGNDDEFPAHAEVLQYIQAYAQNFGLRPHIRLNCRVNGIQYIGETIPEMEAWDQWGGTGTAFGSSGKWHVTVHNKETNNVEVQHAEFVILCVGRFSGLPNIPEFPPGQSAERFHGKVLHSMEYSTLDDSEAAQLIRGKRITIIGSEKSAVDIAAECADTNGVEFPCTMIIRTPHWLLPSFYLWGVHIALLYVNRFAELLVHKPGESVLYSFLATMLSPLRWGISKFAESYLRWKLPLKKYRMVPDHSFLEEMASNMVGFLPENFYRKVEKGSIILRRSRTFGFVEEGIILEGEHEPIRTDVVILATGYKGDQKLVNIFESPVFRKYITDTPALTVPLYRQTIHPRIPRLGIIGYVDGLSSIPLFELRCKWLAGFLDGKFKLPSINEMEKDVQAWEDHTKQYAGTKFQRSCIGLTNIWANDQLCRDMGCNPRRKKGLLAEWLEPYGPPDYAGLASN